MAPPVLPDPCPGASYHGSRHGSGEEELAFSCEVRAVRADGLALAVDELLRALSAHAALAGAVFEARAARLAEPLVPDALLVGGLARDLSHSGIGVGFGTSLVPAPAGADVCVGAGGDGRRFARLLGEHPAWRLLP